MVDIDSNLTTMEEQNKEAEENEKTEESEE